MTAPFPLRHRLKKALASGAVPHMGVDMARRDLFVMASMLGGSLVVVQTLLSLFEAMARYA
jgi:hypothetical protein